MGCSRYKILKESAIYKIRLKTSIIDLLSYKTSLVQGELINIKKQNFA
ncbi:MAG: hypothetical protein VSS52_004630 [Thiotrichaceae bacterium]|nr:hypothetical protein [Thiotrichaceae bacterium]